MHRHPTQFSRPAPDETPTSWPIGGRGHGQFTEAPKNMNDTTAPSEEQRRKRTQEVFTSLTQMTSDERASALNEVITLNMGVAARIARRFSNRGIPDDDLRQVAYLALTRAAQGYDLTRAGSSFLSYAAPTIRGEVRKYFRDHGWMVRPTRRVQEVQAKINSTREQLTARLGREATADEISAHVDEPLRDVLEALSVSGAFTPASLDAPTGHDDAAEASTLGDLIGTPDDGMLAAEARAEIEPLLRLLSDRDRRIIGLRFYRGLTQREIAEDLGTSQMQVSRLLARILTRMRQSLEPPAT